MEENNAANQMNITESHSTKRNDWKILSGILAVVVIGLLVYMFIGNGITGNVVSEKEIGEKAVTFINEQLTQGQSTATLESVKLESGVYNVMVNMNGRKVPVYFTKDGKFISPGSALASITGEASASTTDTTTTPQEVVKSDKPVVEAFIFSYCPYGLQFEKALSPVYELLKNKADIRIVAIGAMHGEYEKTETLRQICIEKNYEKDKLWAYLNKFNANSDISACNGADACVNPLVEKIMTSIGVDKNKINSCMKTDAEAIYQTQNARASELGIGGSPTFVINGAQVNAGRNAEAIKQAICSAFTTAPSECSKTLSTTGASAGFGAGASASGSAASCG